MYRKRDRGKDLERLGDAYWFPEDRTPARVPNTFEARAAYERESYSLQVLDGVGSYMRDKGITQQALAEQLGVSEGRVSQILSGEQNLTLKTLASVAAGLNAHFDIALRPATGWPWEDNAVPDNKPGVLIEHHESNVAQPSFGPATDAITPAIDLRSARARSDRL